MRALLLLALALGLSGCSHKRVMKNCKTVQVPYMLCEDP